MSPRRWTWPFGATLALALLASGCGGDEDGEGAIQVVASTSILADWVAQVGGDAVEVDTLVPENADAHTFSLTPTDIRKIDRAEAIFVSGAGLEAAFLGTITENANGPVIDLSEGLPIRGFDSGDAAADTQDGNLDPHYWMDPLIAIQAVGRIARELEVLAPGSADEIRRRSESYKEDIETLDRELEAEMARLPGPRRFLVTFHDAYAYLARRYGLTILGFVVESPDEEPGAGALADLVEAMRANGVTIIFKEPQFSARVIEQLAADTGAEIRELPSGSLAPAYPTYVEFMRQVAAEITR